MQGMNPMGLSTPWDDSHDIIYLQSVKNYAGLIQWALLPLCPNLLIILTCRQ